MSDANSSDTDRCENCGGEIKVSPVVVNMTRYCSVACSEAGA